MLGHQRRTVRTRLAILAAALIAMAAVVGPAASSAAAATFDAKAAIAPTKLWPGKDGQITVQVRNLGTDAPTEPITITDELPEGAVITDIWFGWVGTNVCDYGWCSGIGTDTARAELKSDPSFPQSSFLEEAASPYDGKLFGHTGYLYPLIIDFTMDPATPVGVATNSVKVEEGAALKATDVDAVQVAAEPTRFGVVPGSFLAEVYDGHYPFGSPVRTAGDHPYELRVNFDLNLTTAIGLQDGTRESPSVDAIRTADVTLPRGFVGNPEATPKCDPVDFASPGASIYSSTACPPETQVGTLNISWLNNGFNHGRGIFNNPNHVLARVAIYNLEPPKGVPADFGFTAGGLVEGHIYPELDPAQNYAIKTVTPNISSLVDLRYTEVTFWGVPGDPSHGPERYIANLLEVFENGFSNVNAPFGASIRPLLTNPMDCGFDNGGARLKVESYSAPGRFTPVEEWGSPLNVTGCDDPRVRFEPDLHIQPSSRDAGGPTGLDVHLEVPQRNDVVEDASELYAQNGFIKGVSTPPMKRVVVTLPDGMTLSPSAAQGLGSCTPEQIGLGTNAPIKCPDNSQYGTLTLHTPILPESNPPKGFIYIAKQNDNPFHNFLSIYLGIEEPERGILVKIPGRIDLDPETGQITTTFDDLPQFPVEDMQMTFKGGVRAGLVNPIVCGQKRIRAEFFSWADPQTPHVVENAYAVTQKPDGSPCVDQLGKRPFGPSMEAGTLNPSAGKFSPFVFRLKRSDDDQEFSQVGVKLPEGLAAKFAGVGICSDAGIAQAERRTGAGEGTLEQSQPSCPASSEIGTTQVGTGVGVPLSYVRGKVYLAGPYKGAPMSLVVISPILMGPYDLGVIAVRTALRVDPVTAQASALSDPFPQIYQGIPVRIRDIRMDLDRPDFTLNPTDCKQQQVIGQITGTGGNLHSTADDTSASLTERFQAANCAALPFKPKLSFRLFGGTKRGAHPKLQAVLKARRGDANIAGASVTLPHSEFLDQGHIRTVCTRVQFAQHKCPAAAIYGNATAVTPLFDEPLSGPVYLRSSSHQLPDLVALLRGPDSQPIEIELSARIDSVNGGIRNSFELVPDAPVSTFKLTMQGGRKGLLVNSTNICLRKHRATAKFTAQNGRRATLRPQLKASCRGKGKKASKKGRGR